MSNDGNAQRTANLVQVVYKLEPQFNQLAKVHGAVNFQREAAFAMQILQNNSYLMGVALGNQDSLRSAVINVASVGLTLSPLKGLAYLVPRKNKVCLDISYRGFVHLAADCGAIKWAKAEVVHEKDLYTYHGMGKEPSHEFEPFGDRGRMVGVFCVAKTNGDEFIVDHMPIDEVYKIRDRSEAWKAFKKDASKTCPWVTDEGEMIKKTIIRRASKMWPMVDTRDERISKALEVTAAAEPMQLGQSINTDLAERVQAIAKIRELLYVLDRPEEKFIEHLVRANRREMKSLDDLTDIETAQAITMLEQFVEQKTAKGTK